MLLKKILVKYNIFKVWEMQERGIRAECLGSHQDFETEQKPITKSFKDGELSLVFFLQNRFFHFRYMLLLKRLLIIIIYIFA